MIPDALQSLQLQELRSAFVVAVALLVAAGCLQAPPPRVLGNDGSGCSRWDKTLQTCLLEDVLVPVQSVLKTDEALVQIAVLQTVDVVVCVHIAGLKTEDVLERGENVAGRIQASWGSSQTGVFDVQADWSSSQTGVLGVQADWGSPQTGAQSVVLKIVVHEGSFFLAAAEVVLV